MNTNDSRKLPLPALQALRMRVVKAVLEQGLSISSAAKTFGVGRTALHSWVKAFREGGEKALILKKRGRKAASKLKGHEAATVARLITDRCPEQLKLPFALWTRDSVRELIRQRTKLNLSVWTVGRLLKKWGFTPQKPLRRAYEKDPKAVKEWLEKTYPNIQKVAKKQGAIIHWGDEMGVRSDHQAGTSYGRKGQTPVILGTGQRFGCSMISTITNRGELSFMVFQQRFRAKVFLKFLGRLIRQRKEKIILIVDGHPVHRAAAVKAWLSKNEDRIQMFRLPGYSPDLNPDELLNQDVKTNAVGRTRPSTSDEMMEGIRSYLRSTQKNPRIVRNYFKHHSVAYAAA